MITMQPEYAYAIWAESFLKQTKTFESRYPLIATRFQSEKTTEIYDISNNNLF